MSDKMKECRVTVRFPVELRRRLKETAKRTGKRESDLVRSAVERHLEEPDDTPTAYELAMRHGLIGCMKGAPPDLSTNKKYFDGFGEH